MIDTLVIVPTFNGKEILEKLLLTFPENVDLLVVDTGSDNYYLTEVKDKFPNLKMQICKLPFRGYGWGAFLWAYWNYPAKNYFLMQDSMEIIDPNFVEVFKSIQPQRGVACWGEFGFDYCFEEATNWIKSMYKFETPPEKGIFGPIFLINRETIDELRDRQLLFPFPVNKLLMTACERALPVALMLAGMEQRSYKDYWSCDEMSGGTFGVFKKNWYQRD